MRSRVQVSLPLPTKNQALASTQVLFFYPFSGFITKFAPPLQRIAAASVHRVPPTHLQKNSKKSAVRLSPAPLREPLEGASLGPLREFLEEPLLGASAGVFGGASARRLPESFWGTPGGAFGEPLRAPWGGLLEAYARHLLESFWGTSAGAFGGSPFGPSAGTSAGVVGGVSVQSLLESFWGASAGTFAGATKNPSSKDGFHTQTLTIQTMQWLNFLLFVSDTKVGQNASWDNRHN